MRGLIMMSGIIIALAIGTWVYMDSWIGALCFAVAVGVFFTIIRHGLEMMGGRSFQQDDATHTVGIIKSDISPHNAGRKPE